MNEFEAVKKAIEIGVKNGIYSMDDIIFLKQSLDVIESKLSQFDAAAAPAEKVEAPAEPVAPKNTRKPVIQK